MSVSQHEAIAHVAKKVGGSIYVAQLAKSVESPFTQYFPQDTNIVVNQPYEDIVPQETEDFVTVTLSGSQLFKDLPLVGQLTGKVVAHVELDDLDFSVVSAIKDFKFPILISSNAKEAYNYSRAAYSIADKFSKPVFHFFTPSAAEKVSLSDKPDLIDAEIANIFSELSIQPFELLNKASSASKLAILYLGAASKSFIDAATKLNIVIVNINVYYPWDLQSLLSLIPNSIEKLAAVTETSGYSSLLLDFFQDYPKFQSLKNFKQILAANFSNVTDYNQTLSNLIENIDSEFPTQNVTYGEPSSPVNSKSSKEHTKAVESAIALESAYIKLLNQVNPKSSILNEYHADKIEISNPEFGYGSYLSDKDNFQKLQSLVLEGVQDNKFRTEDNATLIENLSKWLIAAKQGKSTNENVQAIIDLLSTDSTSSVSEKLLNLKQYFNISTSWLVGSDAWAYDLGNSGVHNLISSGENVNMLIIDSDPYSSKKVNGSRKKDIGLYAMNYGNVYVASVAIYSSYTQVLQAFIEAEKFNGPSIVLAYLPYNSEKDNTLTVLQETKKAVDSGYWPLYRYDPSVSDDKESFKLDSSNLRKQLQDFLDRENKLSLLAKRDPVLSRNLTTNANTAQNHHQKVLADESYAKLLSGLSGPPLTIAFASDGGNAEALAKKINRQALGRGLKSIVVQMDDIAIEDLPTETNVVFVTSTSGQGEFPVNGKQFWDNLKGAVDLDLASVHFSVFGLGDSQYWPRKEDKHYYNKPATDLYAKLKLYGGVELSELGLGDDQDADGFNTGYNEWIPKLWTALGVDQVDGVEEPKPLTNEDMKIGSDFLRGTIAEGLQDQSTGAICAVDQQMTKFHGIYMQDDRDVREERKAQGKEPAYSFMVRMRLPGGIASPQQYLKVDELADERGNGTLKVTTRATFQLHGVVKHNLKPAIRGMNSALMDTLAACGDVNRNVMVSALPSNAKVHRQVAAAGTLISEHLLPRTTAYHEIWLHGDDEGDKPGYKEAWENRKGGPTLKKTLVAGNALVDVEPQYGPTYLPRKFKIVITVPPYNDVDVYAHDIGLIAIVENDVVVGYNLLAGGGMGSTHNNKKTYPRTGSCLGFVTSEQVHIACEKVMLVQRDFGDRTNRKHARLKYTIDDLGVEVFKSKVEDLLGYKFAPARDFKIESNIDYFGWCKDEEGFNHFTCFIENGRIEDTPELPQKTGLRKVAEYLQTRESGEFRLTGNQHILISRVADEDLDKVKEILTEYKLSNVDFSGLRLSSSSCVALPTCGLAMAEAERYLPELIAKLENSLEDYGLRHDSIVMRMTGCPNGCARPWLAEVALVGKAAGAYNLMLGGGHHGERLNKIYRYSIKEDEILDILLPLFKRWSLERNDGEPFGDWTIRAGIIKPTLEGKYFHDDIPEEA
jgi:sulfite reductase (NADPH) hemoprotein beta-component